MFINKLSAKNFRTLEDFSICFNNYYTAISGRNNAGKSNVLRAIRTIMDTGLHFRIRGNSIMGISNFNWKDEVTSWKSESKEDISLSIDFQINKEPDTEIYKYLTDFIVKDSQDFEELGDSVSMRISYHKRFNKEEKYEVFIDEKEINDEYKRTELLKRLQSAECIIFHNSTYNSYSPFVDSMDKVGDFLTPSESEDINKKKADLLKTLQRNLKSHQQELTGWLGKLEEKYEVGLSIQGLDFEREPIDIFLKEKGGDVILDNWGSGTRNRTLIFLKLFNAAKRSKKTSETERIKPIVILEEPESFLHPQAQAEFGRILQDLANQLEIQVITTTHSPYFLSFSHPSDNILLERIKSKTNPCTSIIPTTGDSWVQPFVNVLGIKQENYGPMKDVIFSGSNNLLLVEGITDKKYLNYLQLSIHGDNALRNDIEIFPINGIDSLKNTIWVGFLKEKFKKVGIIIDRDRSHEIKKNLESVGFKENYDLFIVGDENSPYIEGLVPSSILSKITAENPDITRKLMNSDNSIRKAGRSQIKNQLLETLVNMEQPQEMEKFYELAKRINKLYK